MGKQQEINELLRFASKQGFTYEEDGSGHWHVTAPEGVSGRHGSDTRIPSTPRSDIGVNNARSGLKGIGVVFNTAPKKKRKKLKDEPERVAQVPQVLFSEQGSPPTPPPPTTPTTQDPQDQQEGNQVPKIEDIVRVSGGALEKTTGETVVKPAGSKPFIAVHEIQDNLALAAQWVWQHIIEDVMKQGTHRESQLRDMWGYEWAGSRQGMISKIWPELDKPNYHVSPPSMPLERRLLGNYLSASRHMAPIRPGSQTKLTLWWVRRDWVEISDSLLRRLDATSSNWWEGKVTPEEAGETRAPEPVTVSRLVNPATQREIGDVLHRCPLCHFVSDNARSLGTHKARLSDKDHPQGKFSCPVNGCQEVRGDITALANHVSKEHRDLGLQTCRICGEVALNRTARIEHQMRMHPDAFKRNETPHDAALHFLGSVDAEIRSQVPAPTPVALPAPASNVQTSAVPVRPDNGVPHAVPTELASDPLAYLQAVLSEVGTLRERSAAVGGLEQRLEELEQENVTLRERDRRIAEWVRSYPFLNDEA